MYDTANGMNLGGGGGGGGGGGVQFLSLKMASCPFEFPMLNEGFVIIAARINNQ